MNKKPNENIVLDTDEKYIKKNQIGRKFSKIFEKLTNSNYYEGTKYAEFFNELNSDGTSKIYVYDPLEKELEKLTCSEKNELKYLVGLTGMGKTTLLKNYYKISNRDVKISGNDIIIYISFYYADLLSDSPQKSVNDEIVKYFSRAIKFILSENCDIIANKYLFWEEFYSFVEKSKPTMLENEDLLPNSSFIDELFSEETHKRKKQKLETACKVNPLEYYSIMIKYILEKSQKPYNMILIYDDIESKEEKFHKPIVEKARHLHSCFSATESKEITVKTIVSLRAYTFRCNIGRQSEARREYIKNDVILKKATVGLHEIFERRFKAAEEMLKIKETVNNLKGYEDAKAQMQYVEKQLDKIGSNLIYNLANYNLSDALIVYCNIMINLEWIPCGEREYRGAFKIDAENYRITTENIIYAIANGNSKNYNSRNGYIPNILLNDKDGTSLIGLYIIKSLLLREIDDVYGEKYIEGRELLSDIKSLFATSLDSNVRTEYWTHKINDTLNYLYNTGILLRSLYDIEDADEYQIERKYNEKFKVYLSPRGKCIFSLLSKNAVLLELYRDDIYTDLHNNDKLTSELDAIEIFDYLLDYINICFKIETKNIGNAIPGLDKYQEIVGNEYITSKLLEGTVKNIIAYFKNEDYSFFKLNTKYVALYNDIIQYSKDIYQRYNISFVISDYLREYTNNN